MKDSAPSRRVRFGVFEVDLGTSEVRKSGLRVKLQKQPFQVLAALLERPGGVVTREELRQRIWSDATFIDFDHGLNKAINKVRSALGDSADNPRFVETLARQGYRFIAPVESLELARPERLETLAPEPALQPRRLGWLVALGSAVVLLLGGGLALSLLSPPVPPQVLNIRQLTNDGRQKIDGLGTNGREVYFLEFQGGEVLLAQVSALGGETHIIPTPFEPPTSVFLLDAAPDRREVLVKTATGVAPDLTEGPLWVLPVLGGSPRRLGDLSAKDARWSPDGKQIAYFHGEKLYLAESDGTNPRQIASKPGTNTAICWSPDGTRVRFRSAYPSLYVSSIWEVSISGANLRPVFPQWDYEQHFGAWTPNGKHFIFYSPSDFNLWARREKQNFLIPTDERPVRLTSGPIRFRCPRLDPDGKTLFAVGEIRRGELLRWHSAARQLLPYFPGLSADQLHFSTDGQWVTYVTFPEDRVWRSKADGSERLQLTFAPMHGYLPRYSPDGQQIAFMGRMPGRKWKMYVVSAFGGTPRQLIPGDGTEADPNWSPDGKKIVFAPFPWEVPESETGVRILDLETGQVTAVPGSEGLFSPRWSPDGRYITAIRYEENGLAIFDFQSQRWTELTSFYAGFPAWSRDGKHVYFFHGFTEERGIYRAEVGTRKLEKVASLRGIDVAGILGPYGLSLGPDDSPIILRDISIQEIYAVHLKTD